MNSTPCCVHHRLSHDEAGCTIGGCRCNPTYTGETQRKPADGEREVVRRLIVELNERSDDDLTRSAEAEQTTKSTVVNRAIQVYEMVRANQADGGHIVRVRADGTSEKVTFT